MHLLRAFLRAKVTHFNILHPLLRRSQILLTFIRHLTLIKSTLRKKIALSFEKSSNYAILLVHIAHCSVYLHYMLTFIFNCNDFEHFLYVVTVTNCFVIKYFLLTSSKDV